ncbi:hypothetical protein F4825DRAFT_428908 [Nemania diffusa]|nr:hypothetical protein F4825DRAFT_428908 [Nemania diffusa]
MGRFAIALVSNCIFFFGHLTTCSTCIQSILSALCHTHHLAGSMESRREGQKRSDDLVRRPRVLRASASTEFCIQKARYEMTIYSS